MLSTISIFTLSEEPSAFPQEEGWVARGGGCLLKHRGSNMAETRMHLGSGA